MRRLGSALKRAVTVGAVLALTLGMATPATMSFADDAAGDAGQSSAFERNQKMATELDENLETKVTLSFPGKREAEPADVVFVLDKSAFSDDKAIYDQAKSFLDEVKAKAEADGLDIKVGVVIFNRIGNVQQGLTDVVTGYEAIKTAMGTNLSSGTNMHAGLLAAQKILKADTAVKAENKHVILISDGGTYLYCKNGDYTKPYTRSFGNPKEQTNPETGVAYPNGENMMGGIWEYQSRQYNFKNDWKKFSDGSNFIYSQAMTSPKNLAEYLAYYKDQYQNPDKNWAQYDYEYTEDAAKNGTTKPIPVDVNAPCNIDVAYISADDTFQAMADLGYDMNVYFRQKAGTDFDGSIFLKYLARNTNGGELDTNFNKLKAKLVDKIAAGSTVEDFIGADFDFINDPAKISLTANGEKLAPVKIGDGSYGFGKREDGSYRFTLDYVNGDKETLKLTLNEAASPSKPVVLEYSERLVNVPTEPGAHALKVNESATLHPVDGNHVSGVDYDFPVPEVTYTVAAPEPKPEPEVKPTKPSDKKPVKTTKGKKGTMPMTGDTFSILPVIGLVVAGAAVCVAGIILKRRNH